MATILQKDNHGGPDKPEEGLSGYTPSRRTLPARSANARSSGLLNNPRLWPPQIANASFLTLSSRLRRRIEGACPEPVEGRGESNTLRWGERTSFDTRLRRYSG